MRRLRRSWPRPDKKTVQGAPRRKSSTGTRVPRRKSSTGRKLANPRAPRRKNSTTSLFYESAHRVPRRKNNTTSLFYESIHRVPRRKNNTASPTFELYTESQDERTIQRVPGDSLYPTVRSRTVRSWRRSRRGRHMRSDGVTRQRVPHGSARCGRNTRGTLSRERKSRKP